MSAIMVLFILPITNFTAMAAETEVQQRLEFAAEKRFVRMGRYRRIPERRILSRQAVTV